MIYEARLNKVRSMNVYFLLHFKVYLTLFGEIIWVFLRSLSVSYVIYVFFTFLNAGLEVT